MGDRRPLGTILQESGRITDEQVQRVLEYQRAHGGFFGQAAVALGVLSREEMDWALASHFDLPFIFPNADAVDPDAAHAVPADWALAHLAVPIVRAGRTLTVVVAEPLRQDAIDELRTRTGCDVELALASATRIRELIHAVYDATHAQRIDEATVMTFQEFLVHAVDRGAERFGISCRGTAAIGWWRHRSESHRAPLYDGWESALEENIHPSPLERIEGLTEGQLDWHAVLGRSGSRLPLAVRALLGAGGYELMFRLTDMDATARSAAGVVLPASLVTELRLLWRSGAARVGVGAAQIDIARAVLPLLPALVLGDRVRAAHISDSADSTAPFTLCAERNSAFADDIDAYELDAITIDLPAAGYPVRELLRTAPLTFMILDEPAERAAPGDWGINWLLTINGQPGAYAWDLRALHR